MTFPDLHIKGSLPAPTWKLLKGRVCSFLPWGRPSPPQEAPQGPFLTFSPAWAVCSQWSPAKPHGARRVGSGLAPSFARSGQVGGSWGAHPSMARVYPLSPFCTRDAAVPRRKDTGPLNPELAPTPRRQNCWGALKSCGGHAGEAALHSPLILGLKHAHQRPQRAEAGPDAGGTQDGRQTRLSCTQGPSPQDMELTGSACVTPLGKCPPHPVSQENWDEILSVIAASFSPGVLENSIFPPPPQAACTPRGWRHRHSDVKVKHHR